MTPAAVHTFSELRTKIGSGSTVTAGKSAAIRGANDQCVVATHPSSSPASAASTAPLHTLTTRRARGATSRIQSISVGSLRAVSVPNPPGSTTVSTSSPGPGSASAIRVSPVPVSTGAAPADTTRTRYPAP